MIAVYPGTIFSEFMHQTLSRLQNEWALGFVREKPIDGIPSARTARKPVVIVYNHPARVEARIEELRCGGDGIVNIEIDVYEGKL